MKKISLSIVIIFLAIFVVGALAVKNQLLFNSDRIYQTGEGKILQIETSHPYANSDSFGKVWEYTLETEQSGTQEIRLHFKKIEIAGKLKVPDKRLYTAQEIFDNKYFVGDALVIKNQNGEIIDLITDENRENYWSKIYPEKTLILELYTDNTATGYGILINQITVGIESPMDTSSPNK